MTYFVVTKSFLPGQRLCMFAIFDRLLVTLITVHHAAACTCPGESHPGPVRSDGTYVGRSAPEIDVFEALIDPDGGKVLYTSLFMILDCVETSPQVSLSAQWGPYNVCLFLLLINSALKVYVF